MKVDQLINEILVAEGEQYTNDPADSGGPTKWGITQAALAKYRGKPVTADDVKALTRDDAYAIYLEKYFLAPGFGGIANLSAAVAAELTDTGVNCGVETAGKFLQRSLNALNANGTKFPDVTVDGNIGPKSVEALKIFLSQRGVEGETVLLRALNCLQGVRYIELCEARPKDEKFVYGWLKNRVVV